MYFYRKFALVSCEKLMIAVLCRLSPIFFKNLRTKSISRSYRRARCGGSFSRESIASSRMIFLTISNSIPRVKDVLGSGRARSIALELLFNVTIRDSTRGEVELSFKLKPRSPLAQEFYE